MAAFSVIYSTLYFSAFMEPDYLVAILVILFDIPLSKEQLHVKKEPCIESGEAMTATPLRAKSP